MTSPLRRGVALAAIALATGAAALEPRSPPRRVLQVFERNPQLAPIYAAFQTEFRGALSAEHDVEVREEVFDSGRAADARYRAAFRTWLASDFEGDPPDLIVAVGMNPLEFLADPETQLWPGVPVLFGTVDERAPVMRAVPPGRFTGVVERLPVRETIDLALRLFPDTRRIVLFGGVSGVDRFCERVMVDELARYADRVEAVDLVGKPTTELLDRVRALPDGSLLLGISYELDPEGQRWNGRRIIRMLAETGRAPVFSVYREALGGGMLGGVVTDFGQSGRRVGRMAARILGGEVPAAIPAERGGPYAIVLDGRELDRWKVPASRIPPGVVVQPREPTVWDRYSWHMLAALALLALEGLLIFGLLLERRHRREAERLARENLARIAHMSRVSSVGELTGSFAHELNTPLGAALNNAQAARRFLSRAPIDPTTAQVMACLEDIVADVRRAGDVVQRMRGALRREDIRPVRLDISRVIGEAIRLVEAEARDRDVALEVEVAPGLAPLIGDHLHLVQVVLNLVLNALDAVQRVPGGERRVSVRAEPASGGVEIRVTDTGPGIAPAQVERLFEPFYTTKVGGVGLGLAISRSIVEAHGGRMTAEQLAGGGAAFVVFLPAASGEAAARA